MQVNEGSDQLVVSPQEVAPSYDTEVPAPPVEQPEKHSRSRRKHDAGSDAVGMIYGNVGTLRFNMMLTAPLEKMEFVKVAHPTHGFVLGQVSEVERRTNLTADGVESMKRGTPVPIDEKELAIVSIIGYRDDRGLLQVPRTPMKAGEVVYRADEELIKSVVGISEHSEIGRAHV